MHFGPSTILHAQSVDFFTLASVTSDEHMRIMHFIETPKAIADYPDFVEAFDDYAASLGQYCTHKMDTVGLHGL